MIADLTLGWICCCRQLDLLCIVHDTIDCSIKLTTSNVDFVYHLFHDDHIGNDVPDAMPSNNHLVQGYDFDDINIDD